MYCVSLCVTVYYISYFFFFNDTATTEIYTLSLHDALPISGARRDREVGEGAQPGGAARHGVVGHLLERRPPDAVEALDRSEEHTSELQSRQYLVCRLLLEKKKTTTTTYTHAHSS